MKMGEKIRRARTLLHWTTKILAEKTGLSQPYISEIENGNKSPSTKAVMRIAATLNFSGEYLLRDDVNDPVDMEIESVIKHKNDTSKYLPYFGVIDKAIAENVTADELLYAIQFIAKINFAD